MSINSFFNYLHRALQISYLETTITHHKKDSIAMNTVAVTRQMSRILLAFSLTMLSTLLDASTRPRRSSSSASSQNDSAEKEAAEKNGLQTKISSLRSRLQTFERQLQTPNGAIEEEKSAKKAKFDGLLKQLTQATTKAGTGLGYGTTWDALARSVTWVSKASVEQKNKDAKIAKLNKSLETLKNRLVGKSLSEQDQTKAQQKVESIMAQITTLGGKPTVTWAMIAPLIKNRTDDSASAERYLAKALKIKGALSTKSVTPEQADALKASYAKNRKKALDGNPSLASQLPDAALLTIKISQGGGLFGGKRKNADELKLDTLLKELASINTILTKGVSSTEATTQVAKFQKKADTAKKLIATLKSSKKLPAMNTPKLVSDNQAADKYIEAIKKIDAQLTAPPSRLRPLTEAKRLKLITQRNALEKKTAALGAGDKVPAKPAQAQIQGATRDDLDEQQAARIKKKQDDDDDSTSTPAAATQSAAASSRPETTANGRQVVVGADGEKYFVEKRTFGKDKYYDKDGNEVVKGNVPLPNQPGMAGGMTGGMMAGGMMGGMMGPAPMMGGGMMPMAGMGMAGVGMAGMAGMGAAGAGMAYAAAAPVTAVSDGGPKPTKDDFLEIEKADPALLTLAVSTITSDPLTHLITQARMTPPQEDPAQRASLSAAWTAAWRSV